VATRLLLAFALQRDSNCIDIGAHHGSILREIERLAPGGSHIAYEPLPEFAAYLRREFPRVDVRQAALSRRAGEADFKHVMSEPALSGLRERLYPGPQQIQTIRVRVERLDDALSKGYAPDFIKVDVEGAEQEVFEGALATLRRHRPLIVFEHGPGAADHYGTHPDDIWDLLCAEVGLRIFDLAGRGSYDRDEFAASFHSGLRWNYVAHA
jgi:FkbM family methyltransferase